MDRLNLVLKKFLMLYHKLLYNQSAYEIFWGPIEFKFGMENLM